MELKVSLVLFWRAVDCLEQQRLHGDVYGAVEVGGQLGEPK